MRATTWIYAAASFDVLLALFHLSFWKLFRWRNALVKLDPANRGMMQAMNVLLIYFFGLCAVLLFCWPEPMVLTPPGRFALGAMAGFWLLRAVLQPLCWPEIVGKTRWLFVALFVLAAGLHGGPLLIWERW